MKDVGGERKAATKEAERLDWKRRGLSARSRRIAVAAMEVFLADEDDDGELVPARPAVCDAAVTALDLAVGNGSVDLRRGFAVLTFFLEWLPLFLIGTFGRMSRLPLPRRLAYFDALETSSIGWLSMLFVAFKVPLCIPAFEDPHELAETGFDRPTTASRRRLPVAARSAPPPAPERPSSSGRTAAAHEGA